jgi:hypothetical protein
MSKLGDAADVNPLIKFLPHMVNHVAFVARVPAPYATLFITAATKYRGGSRCYRPPDIATRVEGT